jgi:hypothetical protein
MHLFTLDVSRPGAEATPLTSGGWEVTRAEPSSDRAKIYFASTEAGPAERHMYCVPVDGGPHTRLTTSPGANDAEVSPDEKTLAIIHSAANQPPEVYLAPNRPGAEARRVTTSPSDEWRSFPWQTPPLVIYKARDGAAVTARLYTPEMVGAKRDPLAPGVVFVHGAGYLQNAHRYCEGGLRQLLVGRLSGTRGYVPHARSKNSRSARGLLDTVLSDNSLPPERHSCEGLTSALALVVNSPLPRVVRTVVREGVVDATPVLVLEQQGYLVAVGLGMADGACGETTPTGRVEPQARVLPRIRLPLQEHDRLVRGSPGGVLLARHFLELDILPVQHPFSEYVMRSLLTSDRALKYPGPSNAIEQIRRRLRLCKYCGGHEHRDGGCNQQLHLRAS